eukprot:COSAG02_NODE_298_length_25350_cov_48.266999_23_plen_49_part_00
MKLLASQARWTTDVIACHAGLAKRVDELCSESRSLRTCSTVRVTTCIY